jgi:3'-phosphoadenosine 5'-phosphosulfate sulfotransferase (PAPS reductase)/FAD synthetase
MQPEAEARVLYARPEQNGVTGYVAATGRSYFCNDTTKDPLYLEGCKGAKSSLTVPLMLHDQVIGTFNVESPEPGGFSETDVRFLEIFSRDVAAALNTLELLVAEKASTAAESIEAIHGAVALPVDDILNDAVSVMERYIGHNADVVERLQRILRNARDIKQVIQKVGEQMTPSSAHAQRRQGNRHPGLVGRRILVADADEQVRAAAHALLERCGCTVETARDGTEAASMVRACGAEAYDVIIADIRLPDMSGYELLIRLRELRDCVPLVLMTGFGYDPGHSIVKARQAGIDLVLFKPFRIDQLLDTIEKHQYDACLGGGRRDEEKARAKERFFSHRDDFGQWDPKNQRPELWNLFNGRKNPGEHFRVFPLSNFTEMDIWMYIKREKIPLPSIYFAHQREVFERNGQILAITDFLKAQDHETVTTRTVRFRTIGDATCTGAVESPASDLDEVIAEVAAARQTERGTRADDKRSETAMEDRKKEGYF